MDSPAHYNAELDESTTESRLVVGFDDNRNASHERNRDGDKIG